MTEILFLSHRIPYPPDKGDKIRSYNLLKALSTAYVVHLGTFVDDPADWQHVPELRRLCDQTCVLPLDPRRARIRSLLGLLNGSALTNTYYRNPEMHRWVQSISQRRSLDGVFVFSSSMAQYAENLRLSGRGVRVMDFCDVDSDKWRQYASSHRPPVSWLYAREARLLADTEARIVSKYDSSLVIAEAEAQILRDSTAGTVGNVSVLPNGVDATYFDPTLQHACPFDGDAIHLVFTGAMDYHPNVDGVSWFAREVFPIVRRRLPGARFVIVGSNPTAAVRRLSEHPGIEVTGRVPDVRPYLAHAAVVIAPLRIARGVQNKVLEALAMARPVVATPNAVQGIPDAVESGLVCCGESEAMANAVVRIVQSARSEPRGREFVLTRFSWSAQALRLKEIFEAAGTSDRTPGTSMNTWPMGVNVNA